MSQLTPPGAEPRAPHTTSRPCRDILVVDDEPDIRESLKEVLELEGYRVVAASNGREALDRLPDMSKPCVILLDLMMPVMNGWEFAEAVQADAVLADIPIVVVTAFSQEVESERRRIATRGVVAKPVDLNSLIRMVTRFCG
jgi:CheY-like chemotaxis protein